MGSTRKLERQLNLMATLLETERALTRKQIRARVEGYPEDEASFRRAFERDKSDLRDMGIPLDVVTVPGSDPPEDGYRIPHDRYYLRDPGLTADELAALQFAASAVRLDGVEGAGGLWKLGGRADPAGPPANGVEVAAVPVDENVVPLYQAVAEHRTTTFTYNGEERTVDPYRLDFLRGHWYVSGFDHLRGEERNFRVDRIAGTTVMGSPGTFAHPSTTVPGARVQPWQLGDGEPVVARVRVGADQAPMAAAYAGNDGQSTVEADGSVVLELVVTNVPGFRSFVLGFLEHAEVLDPPSLREEIITWLGTIAQG